MTTTTKLGIGIALLLLFRKKRKGEIVDLTLDEGSFPDGTIPIKEQGPGSGDPTPTIKFNNNEPVKGRGYAYQDFYPSEVIDEQFTTLPARRLSGLATRKNMHII